MSKFKAGNQVVCVDSSGIPDDCKLSLSVGEIYTVTRVTKIGITNPSFVSIKGYEEHNFFEWRFELDAPALDEVDVIKEKIRILGLELIEATKKIDDSTKEKNYHETIAKMRACPGRKKPVVGEYNYCVRFDLSNNEILVDFWKYCINALFNLHFIDQKSVEEMILSVGEDNIIDAIEYESNIGL